ncbi:hypothetical protein FPCIR_5933 [Fusarium pseudocircinatum]|uniref:Uncharacterized protein n=1 Tax=Fusarium pseudocircinatum TaxID=56676 RepID=A0A8H5P865_9HYPO|nr:hypothetical protein FPCIR_5933 [Fusarium pseudocircinatum]
MNRLPCTCTCQAEVTRLKARVTILERQLAQIQTKRLSDTVLLEKKRNLPEAATSSNTAPARKKVAKRSETEELITKAELLTCPSEASSKFDRRYLTGRRPPLSPHRAFSKAYLQWTLDDMDPRVTAFRLRHRDANFCTIKTYCQHWHIVDGTEPHEEGDIYVLLLCIDTESVEEGDSGCKGINMFDEEEPLANRITIQPSRIFCDLFPDFGAIWDKGYAVLHCLVLDYGKTVEEDGDEWKWMDQSGRLISRM